MPTHTPAFLISLSRIFFPPISPQRQALEAITHHQQQRQSLNNNIEAMRQRLQETQTRNSTILREVDVAKALVQEYREQEMNNHVDDNDDDDDDDNNNSRQRLAKAKRAFMRVVEEELDMLPASWQEKMLEAAGGKEQQRRRSTFENGQVMQQHSSQDSICRSSMMPRSEEGEQKEEQQERRWDGAKPGRPRGSPPFVTPSSDFHAAIIATATMLQHAPQQQRKSLLLPDWGRERQGATTTNSNNSDKDGGGVSSQCDIRDMTSEERLAVVTHLISIIESSSSSSSAAAASGSSSTSPHPSFLPRLGYPPEWDGRITRAVLELERGFYQDLKAGQPLSHPLLVSPPPSSPSSSSSPEQQQQQQQQQELCCLALLHTLRFSARELLPLDLLDGTVDEAKIAKYHRRVRRAAGMWVALRRHLRFVLGQGVFVPTEIGGVFGEALLGDMSKRERGEVVRLRGKVMGLLESMGRGLLEEADEQREKEKIGKERGKEKNKTVEGKGTVGGKQRGGRGSTTTTTRNGASSGKSSKSSSSSSAAAPVSPGKTGKKGFLSRVLRWG